MSAVMEMKIPAFVRAHTEWHPKARLRGGNIEVKCADAKLSVPSTGDKKADTKAVADLVRNYANNRGWAEI